MFSVWQADAASSRLYLASQSQRLGVLFGLQSQVGDAGILAGVLGGGRGGHHGGCRDGIGCEGRQGQAERRRREHHVGRVRRQVRVQVMLRVGHGAVQLQLSLHLKGEGRHVAMTILRDGDARMEREGGEHALTWLVTWPAACAGEPKEAHHSMGFDVQPWHNYCKMLHISVV